MRAAFFLVLVLVAVVAFSASSCATSATSSYDSRVAEEERIIWGSYNESLRAQATIRRAQAELDRAERMEVASRQAEFYGWLGRPARQKAEEYRARARAAYARAEWERARRER